MNNDIKNWVAQNTALLTSLLLSIGIILILISFLLPPGFFQRIFETFGILSVSVIFVSFLYEKFIAEKHFKIVLDAVDQKFGQMDNIQSACVQIGIKEIFQSRYTYEAKYSLIDIFSKVKPQGRILIVARSVNNVLDKSECIEMALKKGATLEIACISPKGMDLTLAAVCHFKSTDMMTPINQLIELCNWMIRIKPPGSIEFKIYNQPLPDSVLYVEQELDNFMVWDLTFGRDLIHKRVLLLIQINQESVMTY